LRHSHLRCDEVLKFFEFHAERFQMLLLDLSLQFSECQPWLAPVNDTMAIGTK
jgi:hypothetical protein